MASMKAKQDMSEEELEAFFYDPVWDNETVRGLRKHLTEILHMFIQNAIKKITEKGYSEEAAENVILRCGPFDHMTEGDLESNILERALLSLKSNIKDDDSSYYTFQELNKLVDFMTFAMVTTLREIKPTLTVYEAVWSLLMCDLNVLEASKAEIDLLQTGPEIETRSQSESKNQETISNVQNPSGKKCHDTCNPVSTRKRDNALRQTATLLLEKPYTGRKKKLNKKFSCLKDLSLNNKLYSYSYSLKETEEKSKATPKPELPANTVDNYLKSIPCDENGEYKPRNEKDVLVLDLVSQKQELQKELQRWNNWTKTKITQVTKLLNQHREEVSMLKSEKEEAEKVMKGNEAMEGNMAMTLLEITRALNTTNTELNVATSAIIKLQSEQSVIKEEMETERNRSLLEGNILKEAKIKEEEALKKSKSFGSEKTSLEEELKALKRQVGPKQQELEKAKYLLAEIEIRVAKEERETAKAVNEAIKIERERLEASAMAEYEIMKENAEEELMKYETEKKRIEYEISALKLEDESKRVAAMQKTMSMICEDSSKTFEVFKVMSKKKEDRECVMCMHEEMTVVFVPCGHQVLCEACNVKHQERMNECPSCRSPIQKRVHARFAKSSRVNGESLR